jgi:hypothetical protein
MNSTKPGAISNLNLSRQIARTVGEVRTIRHLSETEAPHASAPFAILSFLARIIGSVKILFPL